MLQLVIGNKAYSSWSLRPWILLKQFGIAFEEIVIPLYEAGTAEKIGRYTPTGKVPCLIDGPITVWESIAICEYLAEEYPQHKMWPEDRARRAEARALAAEMHAGFSALRTHHPMNVRKIKPAKPRQPEVERDLARFIAIVEGLRTRFADQGPFLMGEFSILDAMYAPVATRCRTYSFPLPAHTQAWVDHILSQPAVRDWYATAEAEPWVLAATEHAGE
ncbi:glutathione S-transferase family protein [Chitinimonas sp. BJB300]|uniref:glutathione S-transferase family protein n=1 Tax=Chitinimonas sp. BJB300 TaxID=1559339 RepID=UPI000C0CB2C0|nr:glutathione S-transferase family protein [Chitinimonas sp. BJB300]PHV13066.1 glutathione S-transferase [Chitinimonas sp. BJB300]TSJ87724.1 glutathione S-transferase family protein [Chitinimonas sp. BJB300]